MHGFTLLTPSTAPTANTPTVWATQQNTQKNSLAAELQGLQKTLNINQQMIHRAFAEACARIDAIAIPQMDDWSKKNTELTDIYLSTITFLLEQHLTPLLNKSGIAGQAVLDILDSNIDTKSRYDILRWLKDIVTTENTEVLQERIESKFLEFITKDPRQCSTT